MDFITTKFQKKEQDNRSKGQGKKRSLEEWVLWREGEVGSERKKGELVAKEIWDKEKVERRCMKCGRRNHPAQDCKAPSRAKTPLVSNNTNQEPVQEKWKFNQGHLKIMELDSEEDSGNE